MGEPCQVCSSVSRHLIDKALVHRVKSMVAVSQEFGISRASLMRHRGKHLAASLLEGEQAIVRVSGKTPEMNIADELHAYKARAEALGAKAEADKDYRTALLAIRELRQLVETHERVLADRRGSAFDVAQSPSWKRLQSRLVLALRDVPGAIQAIQTALSDHLDKG